MKIGIVAFINLFMCFASHSQEFSITGSVNDPQGHPIVQADVILKNLKDEIQTYTVTDSLGKFKLYASAGKYRLALYHLAYQPYSDTLRLIASSEELNIIIKSDVHGSSEAIKNAISLIKHEEVNPKIILSDIGMITETDVSLAKASNAILLAFNVKPNKEAKKLAEKEKININAFNIIYELLDFIKKKMSGLLTPDVKEKIIGSAEVLEIFKVSKVGKVAGSKVVEGEILQDSDARIIRDGTVIFTGKIGTIFREKNQTKQVTEGLECGITIKNFTEFQKKDIIEVYNSTVIERNI